MTRDTWGAGTAGPAPNPDTRDARIQGSGLYGSHMRPGRKDTLESQGMKGSSLGNLQDWATSRVSRSLGVKERWTIQRLEA